MARWEGRGDHLPRHGPWHHGRNLGRGRRLGGLVGARGRGRSHASARPSRQPDLRLAARREGRRGFGAGCAVGQGDVDGIRRHAVLQAPHTIRRDPPWKAKFPPLLACVTCAPSQEIGAPLAALPPSTSATPFCTVALLTTITASADERHPISIQSPRAIISMVPHVRMCCCITPLLSTATGLMVDDQSELSRRVPPPVDSGPCAARRPRP